ncbi:hypothetical protein C2845_PM07G01660 [Panicum miliaceum]|uniref:Uncharacterized protein n=1 Tax=Panicum miliaceum TaxID=4540 RepID=A0A3L6SQ70_PANMI|nr:hypothetical protein C2845_PM07G01660 [Panicum miliaceum]
MVADDRVSAIRSALAGVRYPLHAARGPRVGSNHRAFAPGEGRGEGAEDGRPPGRGSTAPRPPPHHRAEEPPPRGDEACEADGHPLPPCTGRREEAREGRRQIRREEREGRETRRWWAPPLAARRRAGRPAAACLRRALAPRGSGRRRRGPSSRPPDSAAAAAARARGRRIRSPPPWPELVGRLPRREARAGGWGGGRGARRGEEGQPARHGGVTAAARGEGRMAGWRPRRQRGKVAPCAVRGGAACPRAGEGGAEEGGAPRREAAGEGGPPWREKRWRAGASPRGRRGGVAREGEGGEPARREREEGRRELCGRWGSG